MQNNQNMALSVLNYRGFNVAFEEINGKVMANATQMAKPFGKRTRDWLITQQSQDLIKTVSKARNLALTDLQFVRQGGQSPGTWFQKDVALFFAQWLSPEFYLACNTKLEELITTKALQLPSRHGLSPVLIDNQVYYPYTDALRLLGASTRTSASKRKARHPQHFKLAFGRNFITGEYFDLLKSYYDYKNSHNQLKIEFVNAQIMKGGTDV